jgi:acetyl-CoA synthetase
MSESTVKDSYECPQWIRDNSSLKSLKDYQSKHAYSISNNNEFWDTVGKEQVTWFRPYDKVSQGSMSDGSVAWYLNGKLNVSYNCLDRHL